MIPPHDTEGKQISESVAIKQGIAALLTTSAEAEQKWYDAYLAEKKRAEAAEAELAEARKTIQNLQATIALMQGVQPITNNFKIERDYVALQTIGERP